MLKTKWLLVSRIEDDEGLIWGFERMYDHEVNIRLRANTESEAWEKLGVLLNENVEIEVFEGAISSCSFSNLENAFVTFKVSQDCATSLLKLMNKEVDVQLKLRDR